MNGQIVEMGRMSGTVMKQKVNYTACSYCCQLSGEAQNLKMAL